MNSVIEEMRCINEREPKKDKNKMFIEETNLAEKLNFPPSKTEKVLFIIFVFMEVTGVKFPADFKKKDKSYRI